MKKKFLINLVLLIILNLLVKPFWVFGIEISVQNYVGSFEYGVLFPLYNLSVILNIFLDLGINNYNNKSISQNPALIHAFFPNIVFIKFLLAIVYSFLVFGIAFIIGYDKRQILILILLVVNQFANSFLYYFRSNLSGLQLYTTDSFLSVLDRLIMISVCMIAYWNHFWGNPVSIESFVIIQSASYIAGALITGMILYSKTGRIRFTVNLNLTRNIIKSGLPFALLILLMSAYSRLDAIMLERILADGKVQAGIYAQSFRILDAVNMMGILVAGLLLPMFSRLFSSGESVGSLVKMAFQLLWVIAVGFSVSTSIYSSNIIGSLYHDGGMVSSRVFSVLIFAFIPLSVINIYSTLLTAHGDLKILNIIAFSSIIVNISLNLWLIPQNKCIGAAISGLITQIVVAISQLFYTKYKFGTVFLNIRNILLFTVISVVISLIIKSLHIQWLVSIFITGFLVGLMGIITGLTPYRQILESLKARYIQHN